MDENEAVKMIDPVNDKERICPLLKEDCLRERCAWHQVSGQCSITVLAQAFSMGSKGAGLGPL